MKLLSVLLQNFAFISLSIEFVRSFTWIWNSFLERVLFCKICCNKNFLRLFSVIFIAYSMLVSACWDYHSASAFFDIESILLCKYRKAWLTIEASILNVAFLTLSSPAFTSSYFSDLRSESTCAVILSNSSPVPDFLQFWIPSSIILLHFAKNVSSALIYYSLYSIMSLS